MPAPNEVRILTTQLQGERDADGWSRRTIEHDVSVSEMKQSFQEFVSVLYEVFFPDERQQAVDMLKTRDFVLDEVRIQAEVDGTGRFRLVSGVPQQGSGITLTLKRRRLEETADVHELHLNTPHTPLHLAGPNVGTDSAVQIVGPNDGRVPVDLTGQVNPTPGVLTVKVQ